MPTTEDYLRQLRVDKHTLVENLNTKGVPASDSETFTTLTPKVNDIVVGDYFNTVTEGTSTVSGILKALKDLPLDLVVGENLSFGFAKCAGLENIPLLDTSNVTNMSYAFQGCTSLISFPQIDTSNVTDMTNMLKGCTNLENLPILDTSSVTSMNWMFSSDKNLSDESLDNILQMCINATNYTENKTLYNLGISTNDYPMSKFEALPHYQEFRNAGWKVPFA